MTSPQSYSTFASSMDGLAENHLRMDLKSGIDMADASKVKELISQGDQLAIHYKSNLDLLCRILVEERKHLL